MVTVARSKMAAALLPANFTTQAVAAGPWARYLHHAASRSSALNKLYSSSSRVNYPTASPIPWDDIDWPEGFDEMTVAGVITGIADVGLEHPSLGLHLREVWETLQAWDDHKI